MSYRRIILWGSPFLLATVLIVSAFLNEYVGLSWTKYPSSNVVTISFDPEGRAWLGTSGPRNSGGHVQVFDGAQWTQYDSGNSTFADGSVRLIHFDGQGRAWIVTQKGVNIQDSTHWVTYSPADIGLADGVIYDVIYDGKVDSQNRLWLGTTSGVTMFESGEWLRQNVSGLAGEVEIDQKDRIWVGGHSGLFVFDDSRRNRYNYEKIGQPGNYIYSITIDDQSRGWIGLEHGLGVLDDEDWIFQNMRDFAPVGTIAFDEDGQVWVGFPRGVSVFDTNGWSTNGSDSLQEVIETSHLENVWVNVIEVDNLGRVWIGGLATTFVGTEPRVHVFENGRWLTHVFGAAESNDSVTAITFDRENRPWIGTQSAVYVPTMSEVIILPPTIESLRNYFLAYETVWFSVLVLASIWISAYIRALPGTLTALTIGLLLIGTLYGPPRFLNPGSVATIIGIVLGFFGYAIDAGRERRSAKRSYRWGVGLALLGSFSGFCLAQTISILSRFWI